MISIVFVGRNDNYGGDFEKRLFSTLAHNVACLERIGIEYEVVFVEWNPVPFHRLLSRKIARRFEKAVCYVVGNDLHRYICRNRYIKLYEYHAKNVGARKARGDWLALTNPDDYWGDDVLDFLQAGRLESRTLYRTGWVNIDRESDVNNTGIQDQTRDDPPPFLAHSGDFLLCHKPLFDQVGGYREDLTFTNTHKDSILCLTMFARTEAARKIGMVYHIRHKRYNQGKRRIKYDPMKVPRICQAQYGHADISYERQIADRVFAVRLKPELRKWWDRLVPLPKPQVPPGYGITT